MRRWETGVKGIRNEIFTNPYFLCFAFAVLKHSWVLLYALDEPIFNVDVCIDRLVIIDHPPSFDQQPFTLQG